MQKRLGVWLAFVGVGVIGVVGLLFAPHAAAAETGGYPFADKPCVYAPYAVYSTRANWCPDYFWGSRPGDTSRANGISPYGYFYRNCTDYAAWKVASLGVQPAQYRGLGNAKNWAFPPARNGLIVNNTPAVGSVGVRATGTYGHVAFVEEVYPSGSIRVSQYNKHADGNFSTQIGTPAQLGLTYFVHFEHYMPAAAPVTSPAPLPDVLPPSTPQAVPEAIPALTVTETPVPSEPAIEPIVPPADQLPVAVSDEPVSSELPVMEPKAVVSADTATLRMASIAPNDVPAPALLMAAAADINTDTDVEAQPEPELAIESVPSPSIEDSVEPELASTYIAIADTDTALPVATDDSESSVPLLAQPTAPVPNQWWREPATAPPSLLFADLQQYRGPADTAVSLGYWALIGLAVAVALRESMGVAGSYRLLFGRRAVRLLTAGFRAPPNT